MFGTVVVLYNCSLDSRQAIHLLLRMLSGKIFLYLYLRYITKFSSLFESTYSCFGVRIMGCVSLTSHVYKSKHNKCLQNVPETDNVLS